MLAQHLFAFNAELIEQEIPIKINNPFSEIIPNLAKLAVVEFQEKIGLESKNWAYDFHTQKGKMFGVLVVREQSSALYYIGAMSGKLPQGMIWDKLVPSVFDDSSDDYFINKGMTSLTAMSDAINEEVDSTKIKLLKEERKLKSVALQQQLFSHYRFLNLSGEEMDLLNIFEQSTSGVPPSASGECAAPKLLQFALEQELEPLAIAEFWWGKTNKSEDRLHKNYYPACKQKCRPILEYMLEDQSLYEMRT